MCQELLPGLFRLKIPLPESPLKYLNSYVIRDTRRSLIIDTGLNRKECLEAMMSGLRKLGIDLNKSDIYITHLHADHFGLVGKLATDSNRVFFSRPERELMESWEGFDAMIIYAPKNGFPEIGGSSNLRIQQTTRFFHPGILLLGTTTYHGPGKASAPA